MSNIKKDKSKTGHVRPQISTAKKGFEGEKIILLPEKAMDPQSIRVGMYVRSKKKSDLIYRCFYSFGHHYRATFKSRGFEIIYGLLDRHGSGETPLYTHSKEQNRFKIEFDNAEERGSSLEQKKAAINSSKAFLKAFELVDTDTVIAHLKGKRKRAKLKKVKDQMRDLIAFIKSNPETN
jgi:hypothetical protein